MCRLRSLLITYPVINRSETVLKAEILHQLTTVNIIKNLIILALTILSEGQIVIMSTNVLREVNTIIVNHTMSCRHRNSTITLHVIPTRSSLSGIHRLRSITITYSLIQVILTNLMSSIRLCEGTQIKSLIGSDISQSNNLIESGNNHCPVRIYSISILILFCICRHINLQRNERQICIVDVSILCSIFVIDSINSICGSRYLIPQLCPIFLVSTSLTLPVVCLRFCPVNKIGNNSLVVNSERNSQQTTCVWLRSANNCGLNAQTLSTSVNRCIILIETNSSFLNVSNAGVQVVLSNCTISDIKLRNGLVILIGHIVSKLCTSNSICGIISMCSSRTSKYILAFLTVATEALPSHILSNLHVNSLLTSRIRSQLILESVIILHLEDRSLIDERSLNTLNTFPVEVGLQYDRGELLVNEELESTHLRTNQLGDRIVQRLELLLKSSLNSAVNLILCQQILSNEIIELANILVRQQLLKLLDISIQIIQISLSQVTLKALANIILEHLQSLTLNVK